jgi:hypothetical protein
MWDTEQTFRIVIERTAGLGTEERQKRRSPIK